MPIVIRMILFALLFVAIAFAINYIKAYRQERKLRIKEERTEKKTFKFKLIKSSLSLGYYRLYLIGLLLFPIAFLLLTVDNDDYYLLAYIIGLVLYYAVVKTGIWVSDGFNKEDELPKK